MASDSVTGVTKKEIEELRDEYEQKMEDRLPGTPDFEDVYCLSQIPHQPDDYDGRRGIVHRGTLDLLARNGDAGFTADI